MNIYRINIDYLPTWLVEAESLLAAIETVVKEIKAAPTDSDFLELAEAQIGEIQIGLVRENMDLQTFEHDHPEEYGDYF